MAFAERPYGDLVETTLRVLTWNVWGRFGPWQERQQAIVEVIRSANPDVVLLQECWFGATGDNQPRVLGEALGMQHCFGGGDLLFEGWGLGNGVLSRWPIVVSRNHELPALDGTGWGGAALQALIDGPRGRVHVYSVALDWPPQASLARQFALRHLAGVVQEESASAKAMLVVAGDFNAGPESDEIRMLVGEREAAQPGFVLFDAWTAARPESRGATWSNRNRWAAPSLLPDRRIDYIFGGWPRRGGVGSVISAARVGERPVNGVLASDHYGVVAELRY